MTNNTFLVTGSMGCIGAWVLYHLTQQGQNVVSFDLSTERHRLNLLLSEDEQHAITFLQGDLRDSQQVTDIVQSQGITHIIHLAALQIPFCRANPVLGAQVNVTGTVNIFEAARAANIPHLTYASSVAVYGPAEMYLQAPVTHDAPLDPRTLYGVYKVANEGTAQIYWQDHQISSTALRPYTVYGVGRDQGMTSEPTKAMLSAVKGEAHHISFTGSMEFHLASDVALQFIDAATQASDGAYVYNLGTPPASVSDFVAHIRNTLPNAQITIGDTRLPFPKTFDGSELRNAMPTVYATPLAEGIQQTIEHFQRCVELGLL